MQHRTSREQENIESVRESLREQPCVAPPKALCYLKWTEKYSLNRNLQIVATMQLLGDCRFPSSSSEAHGLLEVPEMEDTFNRDIKKSESFNNIVKHTLSATF